MKTLKNVKRVIIAAIAAAMMISTVAPATAGNPTTAVAKAATTYSQSKAYTNPVASGTATFRYEDGAVFFSNDKLKDYQLTQPEVAAVTSETDQEITQWFDQYGTLWVCYRNQGLYCYNYEIMKKGKLMKWAGETDNQVIKATRLCYNDGKSSSYVGFTYANYYTSGKDLEDYPLPDWYTIYKVFNGEDYEQPTQAPTQQPTQAPTLPPVQTQEPTQVPTVEPTEHPHWTLPPVETLPPIITDDPAKKTPEPVPTLDPNKDQTITNWEMSFWIKKYEEGVITWDQLKDIWWTQKWDIKTENTEHEVIYYYYDDKDRLIKQERVLIGNSNQTGTNAGQAQEKTEGSAKYQQNTVIEGGATGSSVTTKSKSKSSKKSKVCCYTRKVSKKASKLVKHKNGVDGVICTVYWNQKKHVVKFNNHKYTKIYHVLYTSKSKQIILLKKVGKYANGQNKYKAIVVQRAKGKSGKNWKNRVLKGFFVGPSNNANDLTNRLNRKGGSSKGVSNIQAIRK